MQKFIDKYIEDTIRYYSLENNTISEDGYERLYNKCLDFLQSRFENGKYVSQVIEGKEEEAGQLFFLCTISDDANFDWNFGILTYENEILNYGEALTRLTRSLR